MPGGATTCLNTTIIKSNVFCVLYAIQISYVMYNIHNYFLYLGKFFGHASHDLHALTARHCCSDRSKNSFKGRREILEQDLICYHENFVFSFERVCFPACPLIFQSYYTKIKFYNF